MDGVVLDTDVASSSIRGRLPERLAGYLAGRTTFVTFVAVGELMKWAEVRLRLVTDSQSPLIPS